jgi:hypothetical protein
MPEISRSTRSAPVAPRSRTRAGAATTLVVVVFVVLAAMGAGVRSAAAGALFGDDFETGNLSRWSTVSGLSVQQQVVFGGAWAARGTSSDGATSASAQRTLAVAQSDVTARVRVDVVGIGGTNSVNFLKLRTGSGTAIAEVFLTPGRLLGWRNDVMSVSTTSQTVVPVGAWAEVAFHVVVNGTSSTVQVLLDGVPVPGLSSTTASLGTTAVGRLQLGENLTGRVYDLAYDDLTVDASAATPTSTSASTSSPPPASGDPVLAAAGDIACDPLDPKINRTDANACREDVVAGMIAADPAVSAVAALGDVQYECGGLAAFQQSYEKTWGPLKAITHPAVGNHEYIASSSSPPGTDCDPTATAAGYFTYFGAAAGDPVKGYYSYAVGSWHVIVLNTTCEKAGGCGPGSPQETWLRQDLAAHPAACTLAYFHIPLWSSGGRAAQNAQTFTTDLVNAHADVILTGHDHIYERFALQNASGAADPNGVRAFVVGTGGKNHTDVPTRAANSEVVNSTTFGFLRLTLHPNGYDWRFVPEPGRTFSDSGSEACR